MPNQNISAARANQKIQRVVVADENYVLSPDDDVVEADTDITCTLPDNPRIGESHQFVGSGGVITLASSFPIAQGITEVPLDSSLTLTFTRRGKWIPQNFGGTSPTTPALPLKSPQFNNAGVFGGMTEWTVEAAGRMNVTESGFVTYGDPAGLVAPQTAPLRPGFPGIGLVRAGVPSLGSRTLLSAWFPSQDSGSAFAEGWPVVVVSDATADTAGIAFGTFNPGVGKYINTGLLGDIVTLTANDGGGSFILAGQSVYGNDRQGALVQTRLSVGSLGVGVDAGFGGAAAGPMFKLHRIVTLPVGNPSAGPGGSPAVWVYLLNPTSGGVVWHFDGGNQLILPNKSGPVALTNSVLVWGNGTIPHAAATYSLTPYYSDAAASAFTLQYRVPCDGRIRNLYVHVGAPFGNGNDIVYTLYVNGAPTALTATLASTGSDANDLVNVIPVDEGDLIEIQAEIAVDCAVDPGAVFVTAEFAAAA